ncbi:MAG: hypothetical protein JKY09_00290, partial [Crocinitomicaceae bacterium]|nr:hypothetical protein [Crocinitomicaceae bacterium]
MPIDFNILKNFKLNRRKFRPYYEDENDFRRIVIIHSIGAFVIAPLFTYAIHLSEAPGVYVYLGLSYTILFPVYALLSAIVTYFKDKLVYFSLFHFYLATLFAYRDLDASGFLEQDFFYFFVLYAITTVVMQRLYPAILYHIFVVTILLNGLRGAVDPGLSAFTIIGSFLILGITSSMILLARRRFIGGIEDYSDYLKRIMNNPGSGYILFNLSKKPKILDYNNEALRVFNLKDDSNSAISNTFFEFFNEDDFTQLKALSVGHRFVKNISFSKFNRRHYIELKIMILSLKNNRYWLANISDVTKKMYKHEELELKEKRYRNLYFRNKAGVFTLKRTTEIIEGNDSFFKMFEGTLKKGDKLFRLDNQHDWDIIVDSLNISDNLQNYQTQ